MKSPRAPLCDQSLGQLVVIDVQERLAGAMASTELERVVHNTGVLLRAAGRLEVPVVITEQYPRGLGPLVPALASELPADCRRIEKTAFSCARADGFVAALEAVTRPQVVLAGMEAHVCVLQTAIDLVGRGFEVFVVADAVCSRDPRHRDVAMTRLAQAGVRVTVTESVLFEWLGDAAHPEFRAVSRLIR